MGYEMHVVLRAIFAIVLSSTSSTAQPVLLEGRYVLPNLSLPRNRHAACPGLSRQSETLPYPDYICVVPLLHATERAVCTGAVLDAEN